MGRGSELVDLRTTMFCPHTINFFNRIIIKKSKTHKLICNSNVTVNKNKLQIKNAQENSNAVKLYVQVKAS